MNIDTGCRSKQAYLTKADAKRVARLMTARHRDGFHPYECPNCGYFHIGHQVPAFLRRALAERPIVAYGA
jgi:hypothetical protein